MLSSCILSIGKEIVTGIINDTNSTYIASRLSSIGILNRFIASTDDDENDIIETFLYFLDRVDIVITTGGLGPTFDDMTVPSVAKALGKRLILDREAYEKIREFYASLYREGKIDSAQMNPKREKMAYVPEGSKLLRNRTGAAPGIYMEINGKHVFCLPGVPSEMKPMFDKEVFPILSNLSDGVIVSKTYEFEINDESKLGEYVDKLKDSGVYIKSLPAGFDSPVMAVRFTTRCKEEAECLKRIEYVRAELEKMLRS